MNRFFAISCLFLLTTCQETKEHLNAPFSEKDTYKQIGEEIPFQTGMDWIAYYQRQQSELGRSALLTSYSVSDSQMMALLHSTDELVGVAFHYGIDDDGVTHIVAIPVDESLALWTDAAGRILVDTNSGTEISQTVAAEWAARYREQNPSKIWFHFFGANIFDDIAALPFFNSIVIEPAINILNLTPQLLLVIYNDGLLNIGRTENPPGFVYDASNACPPCAVR